MTDVPPWTRGDTSTGPRACPICGSIGTGLYMGRHLLDKHVVALAESRHKALALAAVESGLYEWAYDNVMGVQPVGNMQLEMIRAQAQRYGIEADPAYEDGDPRAIVLNVKGFARV